VSRRPPPNTPQQLVRMFKEIAPARWLKTASEWAGVVNGRELRRRVGRELTVDEMTQVDQFLIDSLERHIEDLDKRRETAANLIREILRAGNERSPYSQIEIPVIFDDDAPVPASRVRYPWEAVIDELLEEGEMA
jgi:hypothetical protein